MTVERNVGGAKSIRKEILPIRQELKMMFGGQNVFLGPSEEQISGQNGERKEIKVIRRQQLPMPGRPVVP